MFNFIILILLFTVASNAQLIKIEPQLDEVLAIIPSEHLQQAQAIVPYGLRCYQRLPKFFLVGTDKNTLRKLNSKGISTQIVDNQPWSQHYAVVSSRNDEPVKHQLEKFSILSIFTDEDITIIKGSPSVFQTLRNNGFFCVEIERKIIPVDLSQTHLPTGEYFEKSTQIDSIIALVSDSTITRYIQEMQDFGTRYCLNPNRDSVFRWVRNKFLGFGLTDVVFDSFLYSGTWQKNIIATIPGSLRIPAEIIVGGHIDSYANPTTNAPGADDNASGTVAALEMARVLKLSNYNPAFTLRFIGFAAEEVGLRGSIDYATKARQQNRDIRVMMNYDMIGYRNQLQTDRDFFIIWYPGSEAFSNLHAKMATMYTTLNPIFTTQYRNASDSWSFYQQNYKTLFCIEHDFNPYYHTANDRIQYLDIAYARDIIKSGLAMVLTLDQLPPSITGLQVFDTGNGTSLYVKWDSITVPDFSSYQISIGTVPGVYSSYLNQSHCSRTITGLTQDAQYYIGVSIIDIAGRQGVIVEKPGVPRLVPLSPSGLSAKNFINGISLSWQKNQELDLRGYYIYRSLNSPTNFSRLNNQPIIDTLWIDHNLPDGTYFYYITAVDFSNNESIPSDTTYGIPITTHLLNPLIISDNGNLTDTLWFGVYPGATDSLDIPLGENELSSPPGSDTFDIRWKIPGTLGTSIDLRDILSIKQPTRIFTAQFQPGASGYPIYLKWLPHKLPGGKFTMIDELSEGENLYINMHTQSLIEINNPSIKSVKIIHQFLPTFACQYFSKWNIVSLALDVENPQKNIVFPSSISSAYTYDGNMYYPQDTLSFGKGYWLKFSANQVIPITGTIRLYDTINVYSGWNLIGSLSQPILTSDIVSDPPNLITSKFFTYRNGYISTDTIQPGIGYWVKVNTGGRLILSTDNKISIANKIKIVQTSELPPLPPFLGEEYPEIRNIPLEFALEQNYPNPFNPFTVISYQLPVDSRVALRIYNTLGQEVKTLVDEVQPAGYKSVEWNLTNKAGKVLPSGVYFYRIEATNINNPTNSFTQIRKMLLVK